ncbi:MAG: ATP-dependent helicase, partial [Treponema sp.]|nr:ATP-dependent helicase [Treponema sp.]
MDTLTVLEKILENPSFAPYIVEQRMLPALEGDFVSFPVDLDGRIVTALQRQGITRIYTHQGAVWETLRQGRHVVVVTPTASGKTL